MAVPAPAVRSAVSVVDQRPDEASGPAAGGIGPSDPSRFLNREITQLDFLDRLLDLAEDAQVPLLEQAKFMAIFSTLLDDVFQTRVAGLKDQMAAGLRSPSPDGRSPGEQLRAIRASVERLVERQHRIFLGHLVPSLSAVGVRFSSWRSLGPDDRAFLLDFFERRVFPVLTPLAVDPGHPFPYISSLSLNLGVVVVDPLSGERRFARVKIPPLLPRFVMLPDNERFVPLEEVIAAHLDHLFPDMELGPQIPFRVTRNADLELDDGDADDLLAAVEMELRQRRFGRAVRLELDAAAPADVRDLLARELQLEQDDIYLCNGPLDLGGLWAIHALERPDLHDEDWAPMTSRRLAGPSEDPTDIFAQLREHEILVHHPYDSFATSVEALIAKAAVDPATLAIKQTLYRTSGESPIVESLIAAAEAGKQVAVLVELKARFDEQANIEWAKKLEEAGVHVVYGLVGLKTHAKAALIVRAEEDGIRRYCHVGTGNYNSETARQYDDVGILSADPDLGADLSEVFNFLTGYSRRSRFRQVVLAPVGLRDKIVELVGEQGALGPEGRITMKLNGLDDPVVIDALYDASRAGTPVDLIVRGICCLRPGVPGLSGTIRVRSVLGRFLEHSRIFAFGSGAGRSVWIGSADLRGRNLDRRVELMTPVTDPESRARLDEVLDLVLLDDVGAWDLGADGVWRRIPTTTDFSVQRKLMELAVERSRRRHEPDVAQWIRRGP